MATTTPKTPDTTAGAGGAAAPGAVGVEWERIELDYRAGIKSLRQIAGEHGITEGAIRKRAKREEWTRDLSERIQDKAEQLVRKEAVRSEVRAERAASERQVVDANAQAVAEVRLNHRRDVQRARRLCMALLEELEQQSEQMPELQELGELLRKPDDKGQDKLNDLYQAVIGLPERTKTLKALAEAMRVLIALEREAFGLKESQDPGAGGDKDFLERLLNARARVANR